jgi:hypothetical protein
LVIPLGKAPRVQGIPIRFEGDLLMSIDPTDKDQRRLVVSPMIAPSPGVSWTKIIPVWIASALVNLLVVGLAAVLFSFLGAVRAGTPPDKNEVRTTRVEEPDKEEFDLTNDTLGTEIGKEYDLNVLRRDDVTVPGILDPTQAAGIPDAQPDTLRKDVPLPPGGGVSVLPSLNRIGRITSSGSDRDGGGGSSWEKPFPGRSTTARRGLLDKEDGNRISEASVARGLQWLALHQAQDGHWSLHEFSRDAREKPRPAGRVIRCNCEAGTANRNDVAATGLALLPFLGAGITHKPGKTNKMDYLKTVEGAVNWLLGRQSVKDGSYSTDMYAHGIAAIAICEAYGLTSDPRLKLSAQRALSFIANAQDPVGGGWRYSPKQAGDTSVTGWQFMALKSGQMAGLSVPRNTLKLANRFLDAVESPENGGAFGYLPGQPTTIAMTAVGLLCRQYSGIGPKNPALQKGVKRLRTEPPGKNNNIYYLYYATQVMHHMQGESWQMWNLGADGSGKGGMRDTLIAQQDKGATPRHQHQIGSWGGSQGGRIMATSLSLLCLEVYYRHLPLYRRDLATAK